MKCILMFCYVGLIVLLASCKSVATYTDSPDGQFFYSVSEQEEAEYGDIFVVIEKYRYYPVFFSQVEHMFHEINQATPLDGYHANTYNLIQYKGFPSSQIECKINVSQVELIITYTLPKISADVRDKKILKIWNRYYPALLKHEQNHAEFGRIAAKRIYDVLRKNLNKPCEQEIQKEIDEIFAWHSKQHKEYDEKTKNGKTEDAYLPFYLP